MAEISKQALKVDNNQSFPNNNNGAITPAILRAFNVNMIDSMVDELGYNVDSGSWNQQIDALEQFTASASGLTTGSLLVTASAVSNVITFRKGDNSTFNVTVATGSIPDISNLNQATASLQQFTASAQVSINNLNTTTASLNSSVTQLNANTASQQISINALNVSSASQQVSIDSLNSKTGSYATTGSNIFTSANTFTSISASSFVSASEFIGNGSKITGITASIALPILDEGIPQGNAFSMNFTGSGIGATVVGGIAIVSVYAPDSASFNALTASFNSYTASTNADLNAIHQATASLQQFTASFSTSSLVSTSSFNAYTASNDQRVSSLETNSASVNISITNVNSATASLFTSVNNINSTTASQQISINNLNTNSASVNTSVTNLNSATASLFTSASLSLITASFDTGTRNLTFTKGNTTTFSVNIPDVSGSAGTTIFEVVYTGENITKGDPLYISGSQGANPRVFKADASNPAKMPVTFVSNETIGVNNTTNAIVLGLIEGIDLTGYTAGQSIYVAEGGGWSASLPSGSNSITQLLGVVTKGGSGGKGLVLNPGPAQLPGLDTGYMWVGGTTNQPIEITTASFASSASFNSYTSSNDQKVNSLIARTGSYITTGSASTGSQTILGDFKFDTTYTTSSAYTNQAGGSNILGIDYGDINDILNYWGGLDFAGVIVNGTGVSNATIPSYNFGSYLELTLSTGTTTNAASYTLTGPVYQTIDVTGSIAATQEIKVVAPNGNNSGIDKGGLFSQNAAGTIRANVQATDGINVGENANFDYLRLVISSSQNGAGSEYDGAQIAMGANFTNRTQFGFQGTNNYTDGTITAYQPLFVSSSLRVKNAFTASLQQGYTWVGGAGNISTLVATSSFAGTTINTGSFATTGSNSFVGNQTITGSLILSSSADVELQVIGNTIITGSLILSSSAPTELQVIGNSVFTGSAFGNVVSMSITSNTASMDLSLGNYFTLTLANTATTHISASNVQPGVSATLVITTGTNSSASLAPTMLQPSGSAYSATNGSGRRDVLSLVAVASGVPLVVSTKNMV